MEIKIIKTEEEYHQALSWLEAIGDAEDFGNEQSSLDKFELLSHLIGNFEKEHFPIKESHPIDIILLKMETMGIKRKDLTPLIGSSGIVSEVLNKKRGLSKKMIRCFSELLKIDQELLNKEFETNVVPKSIFNSDFLVVPNRVHAKAAVESSFKTKSIFLFLDEIEEQRTIDYGRGIYERGLVFNINVGVA